MSALPCPRCGNCPTLCVETRPEPPRRLLRRRKCPSCAHRFVTIEAVRDDTALPDLMSDIANAATELNRQAKATEKAAQALLSRVEQRFAPDHDAPPADA